MWRESEGRRVRVVGSIVGVGGELGCGLRWAWVEGRGGEGEVDTQVDRRHSVCSVFAFGRVETFNPTV